MSFKRKQMIVDRKFQLGTTLSIIGISFLVLLIIIAAIGYVSLENNNKMKNILEKQDQIFQALNAENNNAISIIEQMQSAAGKKSPKAEFEKADFSSMMKDHLSNLASLKNMIDNNKKLLGVIIIFIVIQIIFLYVVLIRKTHRIAGPVFVMSRYMREMLAGRTPQTLRPLRKHDEFQEFYKLFRDMVELFRSKKGSSVKTAKTVTKKSR